MADERDEKRRRESQRILERMRSESESGGISFLARTTRSVHDHVAATDADPSDRLEYWGTRIGRSLGIGVVVAMMVWLLFHLAGRG